MRESPYYVAASQLSSTEVKESWNSLLRKVSRPDTSIAGLADVYCVNKHHPELFATLIESAPEKLKKFIVGKLPTFSEIDRAASLTEKENCMSFCLLHVLTLHSRSFVVFQFKP